MTYCCARSFEFSSLILLIVVVYLGWAIGQKKNKGRED